MPQPIQSEILNPSLEIKPPESHGNMENDATLGEKRLKLPVPDESDHEEKEPNREQKQTRKRIGGPDQELIMGCRSEKLGRGLGSMPDFVDFLHIEHHEASAGEGNHGVEEADHEEPRRRPHRLYGHRIFHQKQKNNHQNQKTEIVGMKQRIKPLKAKSPSKKEDEEDQNITLNGTLPSQSSFSTIFDGQGLRVRGTGGWEGVDME